MQLREKVAKRLRSARHWAGLLEDLERETERIEGREPRAAALFELGEVTGIGDKLLAQLRPLVTL